MNEIRAAERARMVEEQLVARGLRHDRVLQAMRDIPRHEFVSPEDRDAAYDDRPLSIGAGQTISQPYIVAAMTAALDPGPDDRVLEIGTGSGYQAAILGRLAREVVSIERIPELAALARGTLARLGITNVMVEVGDGNAGWPSGQPFDAILVAAAAPRIPEVLVRQLIDGGRLVVPVGSRTYQELLIVRRRGPTIEVSRGEGCVFVPLVGQHGWEDDR